MTTTINNPFKVDDNVNINNLANRGNKGAMNAKQTFLMETLLTLPVDPNKSIIISMKHYKNDTCASQSIVYLQKKIREKSGCEDYTYSCRTIKNTLKQWVETRVFRIK